jgi:transcriptional regulator with XRE-family HTH domain
MSIGKNIALLRRAKGLTQAELGDLLGVSNQAVSKWESEMSMPDVMLLSDIAKVFGVDLNDLYGTAKEIPEFSIPVPESETNTQDRRILNISAKVEGVDVKIRMPAKALQSILDLCFDDDDEQKKALTEILDSPMSGTVIDVDNEDCKAKICVEEYEN